MSMSEFGGMIVSFVYGCKVFTFRFEGRRIKLMQFVNLTVDLGGNIL